VEKQMGQVAWRVMSTSSFSASRMMLQISFLARADGCLSTSSRAGAPMLTPSGGASPAQPGRRSLEPTAKLKPAPLRNAENRQLAETGYWRLRC
jgi:hypothetical protein